LPKSVLPPDPTSPADPALYHPALLYFCAEIFRFTAEQCFLFWGGNKIWLYHSWWWWCYSTPSEGWGRGV